jgi:tetratricopeptide (TPR) repeat protein
LCSARDCKAGSTAVFASNDRLPNIARNLAEIAAPARALLQRDFKQGPEFFAVDMLSETFTAPREDGVGEPNRRSGSGSEEKNDLSRFIVHSAAGARRTAAASSVQQGGNMQTPDQRQRRWLALTDRLDKDPQATLHALAATDELERGFDPADAAEMLFRLADRLRRSGQWDAAAACYSLLATRFPDDPLSRSALALEIQIEATTSRPSSEFAAATMLGPQRAVDLGAVLERERPDLFASPDIRFPLAAAYRHLGQAQRAERLYTPDRSRPDRDGWGSCARGEYWIATHKGPPPKRLITSLRTAQRPKLDGKLDDPIWQRAKACQLSSPMGNDNLWPAKVMFAHDASYLYVAVQCQQAPGARYGAPPTGPRPRDPDLSGQDRVDIFLDIDRTYATYYRLTIDHRGWVDDSFWGDASWNPKWFVAAHTENGVWTAEAAIPFAELSVTSVNDETIWAIGVQRVVPGVGFQSWTTPAATTVMPQGFGWLGFEK